MHHLLEKVDMNPWSYLGENAVSDDTALQTIASGAHEVIIKIALIGLALSLFIAYTKLGSGNANKREEGKEELRAKIVTGIAVFGSVSILGMLFEIFSKFG